MTFAKKAASDNSYISVTGDKYIIGLCCALSSAWLQSSTSVITSYMHKVHFSLITFHYGVFATIIFGAWLLLEYYINTALFPNGIRLLTYTSTQWCYMISIGIVNVIGFNFLTLSFLNEKEPTFLLMIGYITVVWSLLADVLVFGISFS